MVGKMYLVGTLQSYELIPKLLDPRYRYLAIERAVVSELYPTEMVRAVR